MQKFQTLAASRLAVFLGGAALALVVIWPLMGAAQDKSDKAKDPDPHAQHKDKEPAGDQNLASQLKDLHAKVARLEAALAKNQPGKTPGMPGMGDKADAGKDGKPDVGMGGMEDDKMMGGMGGKKKGMAGGMDGMDAMEPDEMMGQMMQNMGQMMQMMGKMKGKAMSSMGDKQKMGMGMMGEKDKDMKGMKSRDMKDKGMAMMDMDKQEMTGMMGMGGMGQKGTGIGKMQMATALPGFPGASHIYHIGASGFFLDHPDHIKLTAKQQTTLNGLKEKALLEKSTNQRKLDEAEQELWTLTASDKPDAMKIDAKVRDIEKLRGDQRMAFITSVGEAGKVLTDDQRQTLMGTMTPDAPKTQAPASK